MCISLEFSNYDDHYEGTRAWNEFAKNNVLAAAAIKSPAKCARRE